PGYQATPKRTSTTPLFRCRRNRRGCAPRPPRLPGDSETNVYDPVVSLSAEQTRLCPTPPPVTGRQRNERLRPRCIAVAGADGAVPPGGPPVTGRQRNERLRPRCFAVGGADGAENEDRVRPRGGGRDQETLRLDSATTCRRRTPPQPGGSSP